MSDWFKEWFASEEYLNVYGHRNAAEAKEFIELVLSKINIPKKSFLLDAACGAGRYAFVLEELGYNVLAFDLSKTLLRTAKERKGNHQNILFFNSDLRNIGLKRVFKGVFNLFTSFGYFESDEENFKFVRSAYGFLLDGGYYVFDYLNSEFVKKNLVPESRKKINGKNILEKRRVEGGRVIKEISIESKNGVKNYLESVKLYTSDVLLDEFSNIGFNVIEILGDYKGNTFDPENSDRFIVILEK